MAPGSLEDARRETRADASGAVRDDGTVRRELVHAFAKLPVRDVDRVGHVSRIPLGCFPHIEEESALGTARLGRSGVELLDPQTVLARRGIGRGVSADVVVPDDGQLLAEAV